MTSLPPGFTLDSITRAQSPSNILSQQTSVCQARLVKRPITKDVVTVDVSKTQIVPPGTQTTTSFEPPLLSITRLGESDVPKLMTILSKYAYKWEDIGIALGFTVPELRGISSQQTLIANSPNSFLREMLNGWANWPNEAHSSLATVEALETALQNPLVGLGVVSEQLRNELQQLTTSNKHSSQTSSSQPHKTQECIERYAEFLKSRYRKMPLLPQGEWPPTLGSQYSEITMIERERTLPDQESVEDSLNASFHGQVDELAKNEKVIKSLDELFTAQAEDTDSSSLKILVEGVPGAGKTTLVQKSCKDWADGKSLQQFNLVVLVVLRKKEIERAKSVEELLPADDPDLKEEVRRIIKKSSGEDVLFIFDGFDELDKTQQSSSSIFLEIIQGELLHNCAVILTSRPYASDVLRTDERIHRHVEILGFTEKQIESYIMHNISNQSAACSLVKSLTEQVASSSFCYTPLSCSILLYIFKRENCKLPSTLTELFDAFISSVVKRHAKKLKLLTRTQEQKLDLNNLPEPLNYQFSALCKLAYDSLVKGRFVFSPQDIEDMNPGRDVEANLLSLMTSTTSFGIKGEETHYQFLHMTIQEFLAARWVATQSEYKQKIFFDENWLNLKIKLTLVFFAGITKLKGFLSDVLFRNVRYSDLVRLVLKKMWGRYPYNLTMYQYDEPQVLDSVLETAPFEIELGVATVKDPFKFETTAVSLPRPSVSRAILKHSGNAAQAFLCLASMIEETKDPSLVRRIFMGSPIKGFYLDFCRLTPMDCLVVANCLSQCPHPLPTLHFNFCSLTSVSLEILQRISSTTPNCLNRCTEVQMNYNGPSFSKSLSLLPLIQWFQHTKTLCLCGLQYPKGHPPEAFQLQSLLSLKVLSDLTVTVERIPNEHLKDHEAVLINFFEALKSNNTLSTLTYNQSPSVTNCRVFVQLMSALSQNKLLLTLGHAQVITQKTVILPSKSCFRICSNGLMSAMKLADTRGITILEAHCQDLFLESCTCQTSHESKLEPRLTTTCNQCENTALAVIYCSNCSANLCESCSKVIHRIKMFKDHKLISVQTISQDFSAVSDSLKSSSLEVLDISECTLTNEVAECIGAGLAENKSLKQLNIKTSVCAEALYIFRALEHNSCLQKLKISLAEGIGSSETAVTTLSQMLKINKSLVVLDLSGCGVTDVTAQHIASGLAENKTLQALNVNSDQLGIDGAGYILQCLQQNETLKVLRVFDLQIQITSAPLTLSITAGTSKKPSLALLVSTLVHNTSIEKLQMFTGTGVLDLSECSITDAMVKKIAAGLMENSSLKQLDLSGNEITSVGSAHIFRSLEHSTSLEELLLSYNPQLALGESEMFGSGLQQMLTKNKSLSVLDLSDCGITDAVAQQIALGLAENKTLQALSIDSVHLTHEGVKWILQSIKENKAMKILKQFGINLEILYNPFCLVASIEHDTHAALNVFKSLKQDTTVEGLVICRLPSLEERNNFGCYLSDINEAGELVKCGLPASARINEKSRFYTLLPSYNQSAKSDDSEALGCAVEGTLTVNQTLKVLDLQNCDLDDVAAGHIANGLAKNSSVKQLNLISNKITSVGAAHIFKSLEHNTSLEELDLEFNKFFPHYQSVINDESKALGCAVEGMLTVNQTLRILNLQDCHLNDVANHIANGLAKNNSVKQLKLCGSRITGVRAAHIFKSLEHNTSLEELDVSVSDEVYYFNDDEALGCAVEGMLTVNQTLRIVNLQDCHLNDVVTGHIANGLAKNNSVNQLSMKSNRITSVGAAHIFKSLEHNTSLEELDLSSNEFFSQSGKEKNDDSEVLGCAVEGMLTVNQTLRILNLQDCELNSVVTGHIATGLQYNSSCTCYTRSTHIRPLPRKRPPSHRRLPLSSPMSISSPRSISLLPPSHRRLPLSSPRSVSSPRSISLLPSSHKIPPQSSPWSVSLLPSSHKIPPQSSPRSVSVLTSSYTIPPQSSPRSVSVLTSSYTIPPQSSPRSVSLLPSSHKISPQSSPSEEERVLMRSYFMEPA